MKKTKLIPFVLASALLVSCGDKTNSSGSKEASSNESASASSSVASSESSASAESSSNSEGGASSSNSEEDSSSISSEESVSSSEESSSSSEESSSGSSTSSEEKTKASWKNITADAANAITTFFETVDDDGTAHNPDDYIPVFETEEECEWIYDSAFNYQRGFGLGLICKTGTDANANKALIASYNALLEEAGMTQAASDEIENYNYDYYLSFFGENVWVLGTDFDIDLTIEVITVAEANEIADKGDGYDADPLMDQDSKYITDDNGVFILIQSVK